MSDTPDVEDFADALAEQDAPRPAGLRLFPILVVAMAVFPIALGIGFTLQTVTPPAARLDASESPPPPLPNNIQPRSDRHLAGPDRSKGDDLLCEGRYEAALHHYRSLGSADTLRVATELAFRIGLCQEGLGLWDESLATYRSVASSNRPILATAGILGQSRVWMRLNDFKTAEPLFRTLLLQAGDPHRLPPDAIAEIVLLQSICIAEQGFTQNERVTSVGLTPVGNLLDWSMNDALKWADAKPPAVDAATDTEISVRVSIPPGPKLPEDEPILPEVLLASEPLAKLLQLVAQRQSLAEILPKVADECGLQLQWSESIREQAARRVIDAHVKDIPLVVVLTTLCREINAEWTISPQSRMILITSANTDPESHQRQCEIGTSLLTISMTAYPNHRLSGPAKFAQAQLAMAEGRLRDAAQLYSSLIGRSISPLAIRAAFNAALAYHQTGNLRDACRSLEIVVHGAPGNELHTQSIILYGRTLMDLGEFHEAAYQLKRAAGSRHRPEDQARAAVFLSMAQLLDGRPHDAAESLFAHRLQFQDRTVRNAAALMTSIARWRTATGSSKDRESTFLYRSIVAVDPQVDWLGPTGQLLLGQAMHEISLEDRMAELYTRALDKGVPSIVEIQMRLGLADYWYTHNRVDDAKSTWSAIYKSDETHSLAAGMRLAVAALDEKQPGVCLNICQALQADSNVSKSDLLKLAGRAYEQAGFPVLAAKCYAGQWPLP